MQISDLEAQNLLVKNAYTSIGNLQSAILNHTCLGTPGQLSIITFTAIEL
jgi:hypothetical protein